MHEQTARIPRERRRPAAQARPPAPDGPHEFSPDDPSGLQVRTYHDHPAGVTILGVTGDLELSACSTLASAIGAAADAAVGQRVIVDLTGVRAMANCGATVLQDARAEIERHDGCLQLVVGPLNPAASAIAGAVRRQTGLHSHATVAEARTKPAPRAQSTPPDSTARRPQRRP